MRKRKCQITGQMIDFETEIDPPYELIRQYEEVLKKHGLDGLDVKERPDPASPEGANRLPGAPQ